MTQLSQEEFDRHAEEKERELEQSTIALSAAEQQFADIKSALELIRARHAAARIDALVSRQGAEANRRLSQVMASDFSAGAPKAAAPIAEARKTRRRAQQAPESSAATKRPIRRTQQPKGGTQKAGRARLPVGGRGALADACERFLSLRGCLKKEDLFDLLQQDQQLKQADIQVPGDRGGNYLSALMSEQPERFLPDRKRGWSLNTHSKT